MSQNDKIIQFKCPGCGHFLVEEEYYDTCEEIRSLANQIAKQFIHGGISELEIERRSEVDGINGGLATHAKDARLSNREGE